MWSAVSRLLDYNPRVPPWSCPVCHISNFHYRCRTCRTCTDLYFHCGFCLSWNSNLDGSGKCDSCGVNKNFVWTCDLCSHINKNLDKSYICESCSTNRDRTWKCPVPSCGRMTHSSLEFCPMCYVYPNGRSVEYKSDAPDLLISRDGFINAALNAGLSSKSHVPDYVTRRELEEKTTFDGSRLSTREAFLNLMKIATIERHISSDALNFVRQVVKEHEIRDEDTASVLKSLSLSHDRLKELQIIHDSRRAEQIRRKLRQDFSYAEDKMKEIRDGTRIPKIEAFATILRIATVDQRLSPGAYEYLKEITSAQVIDEVDRKQAMILARTSDEDMKEMITDFKDGKSVHLCCNCAKLVASCVVVECMHAVLCKSCFESADSKIDKCPICFIIAKEVRRLY